jgi:glycosyltransferase involved in cell wall biosynthesis
VPGARNKGFSQAKGDILMSIDSDMILESGLLEEASRIGPSGALVIPEVGHGSGFLSRVKDLEKRCYLGHAGIEASRIFRRDAYVAAGGFDSGLHFGEDWDIHRRIADRFPVGRTSARVRHDTSGLTFWGNLRKAYLYGRSMQRFMRKGAGSGLHLGRFNHRLHLLAAEPLHAFGLILVKCLEALAAMAGILRARLGPGRL